MTAKRVKEIEIPEWLAERKKSALAKLSKLELPTTRTSGWEFTDLEGFDPGNYAVTENGDRSALGKTSPLLPPIAGTLQINQVDATSIPIDGTEVATTSDDRTARPNRPVVMSLERAACDYPEIVKDYLGSIVTSDDYFVTENDANWRGGAFIYVPAGEKLEAPVQITVAQNSPESALFWRTLIVLEEGAEAEVWEQYLSTSEEVGGLFNTVVEIRLGTDSNLRYVCGQGLSKKSFVFGAQRAYLGRDASIDWTVLGFGSANGKMHVKTELAGDGSNAKVTGAYLGNGDQHLDFDTTQEHVGEHTTSDLAFRGLLGDRATAVWRGMIEVKPGAQNTDAFQESRNLLVSKEAHADAIPGLEIEADNVRCTHAAAVARIDKYHIYYLMSHGLPREVATRLIIDGFMEALVERLDHGPTHDAVSEALERRLESILG